jgi:hypothetical protein
VAKTIFDLADPSDFTLQNVGIVAAVASLLKTAPGVTQTRSSDFGQPSDYEYNPAFVDVDVTPNQLNLKDLRPLAATFFASMAATANANWSNGSPVASLVGGAAVVGGKLDLTGGGGKYARYDAVGNADSLQQGAFNFKYIPNYSVAPAALQMLLEVGTNLGDNVNVIALIHDTDGQILLYVFDGTGVALLNAVPLGAFSPTIGQTYELELNFNITVGAVLLFIDGVQFGATQIATGIRSGALNYLLIGNNRIFSLTSNFSISDLVVYSNVQHTANYTPGPAPSSTIYTSTPQAVRFTGQALALGANNLNALLSLANTFTPGTDGEIRWTVSIDGGTTFLYWNGSAWAVSSGFGQSNTLALFNANLSSLNLAAGSAMLQAYVSSPTGTSAVVTTNVVLSFKQFQYQPSGSLITNSGFTAQTLTAFLATLTTSGLDSVQFAMIVNGQKRYWNGSAWANSDGSFAKTNSLAVIQSNLASLLSVNSTVQVFVLFTSADGSTTPDLSYLEADYSFGALEPTRPNQCILFGFLKDIEGNPVGAGQNAKLVVQNPVNYFYGGDLIMAGTFQIAADANGYFEIPLVEGETYDKPVNLSVTYTDAGSEKDLTYNLGAKTIPNAFSASISTLT